MGGWGCVLYNVCDSGVGVVLYIYIYMVVYVSMLYNVCDSMCVRWVCYDVYV